MSKQDIIVIGTSAGGVSALEELAGALPEGFNGSIFIVLHIPPYAPSHLPEILTRSGVLKCVHPKDGEKIKAGRIYVAPPDHHLLIGPGTVLVKKGPKENRFRPSIDALFRSAAYTYGSRVIGIVLTGVLNDGTSGLWSVKRMGGTCIVQTPNESAFPEMALNVLEYVKVDHIASIGEIAVLLDKLSGRRVRAKKRLPVAESTLLEMEVNIAMNGNAFKSGILGQGEPTAFVCPECDGALVRLKEGKMMRYRCHTGHAFTASALLAGITNTIEESMWKAMQSMEASVLLLTDIAKQYTAMGHKKHAAFFLKQAMANTRFARTMKTSINEQVRLSENSQA
jgi:two-component system chemotaxis response regulator CheB